jgi:phage gp29-like protein
MAALAVASTRVDAIKKTIPTRGEVRKARARLGSSSRGKLVPDLALWNQAARIGGGITPARISSIIRQADAGEIRQLIDLSNECRQRDAHLQAVLGVSEESIAALPWQVVAPKDPRAKDTRAAEWVGQILRECPGMQRLIADLAGAVFYSYSVVEIVWTKEEGKLVPQRFVPVAPRRFKFRSIDGQLVFHDDGADEIVLEETHPKKFIISRPRVTGDVPTREGLMRVLVWMSVMRNWSIGDWMKTGELSWKPWRIGTYKKATASKEDREDLETVMQRLTTDFSAVIPDSTEIAIEWPGGAGMNRSTHGEIMTALSGEMSKAVLGQTETTQSSSSSGYAQAKVMDGVRKDLREARARQIGADLTRDLIEPLILLNFGTGVRCPRFEFITQDPVDLKSFSEAVVNLTGTKLKIPQAWVREQAGIPEPEGDEEVLGAEEVEDDDEEEDSDEGDGKEGDGKEGDAKTDDEQSPEPEEPADEDPPEPAKKPVKATKRSRALQRSRS